MIQSSNYNEALQDPIFKIITQAAKELQVEAYVIGGFVRDFILERNTKKDIDIVAVGTQSLISLRVVRVYHMLIESPTREFLATKGLSFFCAVVINVIKLERPVVREFTFCARHTVVLKDLASPSQSIFS